MSEQVPKWDRDLRHRLPGPSLILYFGFVWLMTGFALGTLTLLGPVRWVTEWMRSAEAAQGVENAVVVAIIVVFVATSAAAAVWLVARSRRAERALGRGWPPALATVLAMAALWLWFQPQLLNRDVAMDVEGAGRFVFGPYPDAQLLDSLKRAGFSGVISLLHPAVVPFEPILLEEERKNAATVGIELVHAPMLPWVSGNVESVARIRDLIESGRGRWFVHCYLGRDRVGMVRRLVAEHYGEDLDVASFERPRIADEDRFERGEVRVVYSPVYVTPFPSEDELLAYFVDERVRQVVSILDPSLPDDLPWIEREEALVERYGLPYVNLPIRTDRYDARAVLSVAARIRAMPHPVVVHGFLVPSVPTQAVRIALHSGLPPLPPLLFEDRPLDAGQVRVVAPNVAVGPTPTEDEALVSLPGRGIRAYVLVGGSAPELAAVVQDAGYFWLEASADDETLIERLGGGGPWYVFGPDAETLAPTLEARLGPVFRDTPR